MIDNSISKTTELAQIQFKGKQSPTWEYLIKEGKVITLTHFNPANPKYIFLLFKDVPWHGLFRYKNLWMVKTGFTWAKEIEQKQKQINMKIEDGEFVLGFNPHKLVRSPFKNR